MSDSDKIPSVLAYQHLVILPSMFSELCVVTSTRKQLSVIIQVKMI